MHAFEQCADFFKPAFVHGGKFRHGLRIVREWTGLVNQQLLDAGSAAQAIHGILKRPNLLSFGGLWVPCLRAQIGNRVCRGIT